MGPGSGGWGVAGREVLRCSGVGGGGGHSCLPATHTHTGMVVRLHRLACPLQRLPPALLGLPSLTSLVLSDVGLGKHGPGPLAAVQVRV